MEDAKHGNATAKGCVVFISWENLDRMYDVKMDKESLYNNGFVPLREEAELGVGNGVVYDVGRWAAGEEELWDYVENGDLKRGSL